MPRDLSGESVIEAFRTASGDPWLKLLEVDTEPQSADGVRRFSQYPDAEQLEKDGDIPYNGDAFEGIRYPLPGWTLNSTGGDDEARGAPSGTPSNNTLYLQLDAEPGFIGTNDLLLQPPTLRRGTDGLFWVYFDSPPTNYRTGWNQINKGYVTITDNLFEQITEQHIANIDPGDAAVQIYINDDQQDIRAEVWVNDGGGPDYITLVDQFEYSGYPYYTLPFKFTDIEYETRGKLPELDLTVANIDRRLVDTVEDAKGGIGSAGNAWQFKIIFVRRRALSRFIQPDPDIVLPFRVKSTEISDETLSFKLGAENIMHSRFPPRTWDTDTFRSQPRDLR